MVEINVGRGQEDTVGVWLSTNAEVGYGFRSLWKPAHDDETVRNGAPLMVLMIGPPAARLLPEWPKGHSLACHLGHARHFLQPAGGPRTPVGIASFAPSAYDVTFCGEDLLATTPFANDLVVATVS
jgi:hypothetical protein